MTTTEPQASTDHPQHPDFWAMAKLLMQRDEEAVKESKSLPQFLPGIVDEESLFTIAKMRCMRTAKSLGIEDNKLVAALMTAYFDAFLLGHGFAEYTLEMVEVDEPF